MLERLKEILIENTAITDVEITAETNFKYDLDLNSFEMAQLAVIVEDEFDIEITDKAIGEIETVGDLMAYIRANDN